MSYQTALTIANVIKDIDAKRYLLPSIQREFVWGTDQIEKLFDSLMRDYPINAFLFWKVPKEKVSEFKFYEFLREYHQKDGKHNPKANTNGTDEVMAILDGQQRMTSLYIALKGTYAYKLSYKRWDNPSAYPKRKMYLNLLSEAEEADIMYDFQFLTDEEAEVWTDDDGQYVEFWFPVGKILDFKEESDVNDYLIDNELNIVKDKAKAKFANKALFKLFSVIHNKQTISYYLEDSAELDKVLNIFIRVNSGGTTLSYSDLLLSFATAQWEHKDAREEINGFVDEINLIGRGFNIGKDIVLKSCLVLCDFSDITFKVDNFNRTNMLVIEKKWDELTAAIRLAVELVSSYGFCRENLNSNSVLIPIAYYIKTIGSPQSFVEAEKYEGDRVKIKKWMVSSLLRRTFSSQPDGILRPMREVIQKNPGAFPLAEIIDRFKGTNRDIKFTDDTIENLLWTKYGSSDALVVLSILYPWADLKNVFHIDHIFPKSQFTPKRLKKKGVPDDKIDFYTSNVNYLGNLQLLGGTLNKEKSDKDFEEWLKENYKDVGKLKDYKEKHYIPDVSLAFTNFEEFFDEREKLLTAKLKEELM